MVHGDHWGAVFDIDEPVLVELIAELLNKGKLTGKGGSKFPSHPGMPMEGPFALAWPETPLRFLALCIPRPDKTNSAEYHNGFPFCAEGVEVELRIEDVRPEPDDSVEGCITGYSESMSWILAFYDPLFLFCRDEYAKGQSFRFSVAALALTIREAEETAIEITQGGMLEMERQRLLRENPLADVESVKSVTIYVPADASILLPINDTPEWSEYRGPVTRIEEFELLGERMLRLWTKVISGENRELTIPVYASRLRLGDYQPAVGDSITGVAWLQGYALDA